MYIPTLLTAPPPAHVINVPPKINPITKRFIAAYYNGLEEGIWSTQEEVAKKLKYKTPNALSYVLNSRRNIPLDKVILFCEEYDFSLSFILTGKEDETGKLKQKVRDLEKIIRDIRNSIKK